MEKEVPSADLLDRVITVRARSGKSWDTTIAEVVEQAPDHHLDRIKRLYQ